MAPLDSLLEPEGKKERTKVGEADVGVGGTLKHPLEGPRVPTHEASLAAAPHDGSTWSRPREGRPVPEEFQENVRAPGRGALGALVNCGGSAAGPPGEPDSESGKARFNMLCATKSFQMSEFRGRPSG